MSKENISAPKFAVLPDTADFLVADTPAFAEYAAKRPWIVIGEKFENGYIIADVFRSRGGFSQIYPEAPIPR